MRDRLDTELLLSSQPSVFNFLLIGAVAQAHRPTGTPPHIVAIHDTCMIVEIGSTPLDHSGKLSPGPHGAAGRPAGRGKQVKGR